MEPPVASSRKELMIAVPLAISLGAAVGAFGVSSVPQSLQIMGYSGHLGEWELTATLARTAAAREFSGPIRMTHTGWCSADGPEQKTGEMRMTLARLSSRFDATLRIDGVECSYSGGLSDTHTGMMACPGRRPVPLMLWMK
jgi:hypothetical protein